MDNLRLAIRKEDISQLPPVEYDGGIQVVETIDKARIALRELSRARIIGFDTETRPSFKKGLLHKVALMQLATDDFCFLFRLNKLGMFDRLKAFLENPEITKVGLSVHDDFTVLGRSREIASSNMTSPTHHFRRSTQSFSDGVSPKASGSPIGKPPNSPPGSSAMRLSTHGHA